MTTKCKTDLPAQGVEEGADRGERELHLGTSAFWAPTKITVEMLKLFLLLLTTKHKGCLKMISCRDDF